MQTSSWKGNNVMSLPYKKRLELLDEINEDFCLAYNRHSNYE